MDTLAIVATKGGVGKTTLAVHLGVAAQQDGHDVLILDLDPQGSAAQWGKDRTRWAATYGAWFETRLDLQRIYPNELAERIEEARAKGYSLIIVDTPPHADFPAARSIEIADLVLVPTRAAYFDLHAAKATIAAIKDLKASAFFVVNQLPHNSMRIADDAALYLEGKGLAAARDADGRLLTVTLLAPYARALKDGMTAPELQPEGRHAQEIGALWAFAKDQLARTGVGRVKARPGAAVSVLVDDPLAGLLETLTKDAV